jgi:hypothetical protein
MPTQRLACGPSRPDVFALAHLHFLTSDPYLGYVLDPSASRKQGLDALIRKAQESDSRLGKLFLCFGNASSDQVLSCGADALVEHQEVVFASQGYIWLSRDSTFLKAQEMFGKRRDRNALAGLQFIHVVARALGFYWIQKKPSTRWAPPEKRVVLQALRHAEKLHQLVNREPWPLRGLREDVALLRGVLSTFVSLDTTSLDVRKLGRIDFKRVRTLKPPRVDATFFGRCFVDVLGKGFYHYFGRPLTPIAIQLLSLIDSPPSATFVEERFGAIGAEGDRSWRNWLSVALSPPSRKPR